MSLVVALNPQIPQRNVEIGVPVCVQTLATCARIPQAFNPVTSPASATAMRLTRPWAAAWGRRRCGDGLGTGGVGNGGSGTGPGGGCPGKGDGDGRGTDGGCSGGNG
jgi:hypothetical protein